MELGQLMYPAYTRVALYIITPSSLKERDNSVGNVGKSETKAFLARALK